MMCTLYLLLPETVLGIEVEHDVDQRPDDVREKSRPRHLADEGRHHLRHVVGCSISRSNRSNRQTTSTTHQQHTHKHIPTISTPDRERWEKQIKTSVIKTWKETTRADFFFCIVGCATQIDTKNVNGRTYANVEGDTI